MLRFFRQRVTRDGENVASAMVPELGPLEQGVMDIVWTMGEANVRDVAGRLERPLAYTTVMTTLDRLYKKGLLERQKSARAFVYAPRLTRDEWERERANSLVAGFLSGPQNSRELLISCLLDAVGEHDEELLESLEKKIRKQRRKLLQKEGEA